MRMSVLDLDSSDEKTEKETRKGTVNRMNGMK